MRKPLVIIFSLALTIAPLTAQEPIPRARVVAPPAAEKPKPTPAPRRSLGEVLFGKKQTPTPTPAPTPRPRQRQRQRATQEEPAAATETAAPAEAKADAQPKPETKPDAAPAEKPEPNTKPALITAPESAPEPAAKPDAEPKSEPAANTDAEPKPEPKPEEPKPVKGAKGHKPKTEKAKPDTAGMDDAAKFKTLKALALEDAQVKELKAKADSAVSEADAHRASVAYNKALFQKIRELDPSVAPYSEKIEQAMMKRLNSEKRASE